MEYSLNNYFQKKQNNEPEDKYGVHFTYEDLCQRLLVVKRQQDRQLNGTIFKSFDKMTRQSPGSGSKSRHKSKNSLRSISVTKNPKRGLSSDFKRATKIYSPTIKTNIQAPERFLGTLKFPKSVIGLKSIKKRPARSRLYKAA
jgi:hypothetical protein